MWRELAEHKWGPAVRQLARVQPGQWAAWVKHRLGASSSPLSPLDLVQVRAVAGRPWAGNMCKWKGACHRGQRCALQVPSSSLAVLAAPRAPSGVPHRPLSAPRGSRNLLSATALQPASTCLPPPLLALVQEHYPDPYQHLVACVLCSRTTGGPAVRHAIQLFLELYPTPSEVLAARQSRCGTTLAPGWLAGWLAGDGCVACLHICLAPWQQAAQRGSGEYLLHPAASAPGVRQATNTLPSAAPAACWK